MTQGKFMRRDGALLLTILVGMASVVGLSHWIDAHRPASSASIEEEKLYLTATTVRRASLGFNGLAADWYWMRSLQYVGGKIVKLPEHVQLDHLGQLNLKLLAPLLDATTTLDPQFMEPFQYAAVVLPDLDINEAIRIVQKGIAANPSQWRLYHHLGFIYWRQKDFKSAGDAYEQGARVPGAPPWMKAMRARMASEGGSRNTAREIYQRMYEEATDDQIRNMARKHLLRLNSMDEQDLLRRLLVAYKSKMGRCPESWRQIEASLHALRLQLDSSGAPRDPSGTPYQLVKDKCDVTLGEKSEVPLG
jgi:tetratricopeptide (TPR) repeat protein